MGFSPKSYTFMAMSRLHRADSQAKLGVVSGWWLVMGGDCQNSKNTDFIQISLQKSLKKLQLE